ncbi:MAG: TM2 domain-containing protein, partial [Lentisphaeria bacterium]|nr:TM2 domain-containing protein [Lentisphaeria bacterium]
ESNSLHSLTQLGNAKTRIMYVYLCSTLGLFGIHEFYIRRTFRGIFFLLTGIICLISGLIIFIPNFWSFCSGKSVNTAIFFTSIILISIAVITFLVCIGTAIKWLFRSDNEFALFVSNAKNKDLKKQRRES